MAVKHGTDMISERDALLNEISQIENDFKVSPSTLKRISSAMVNEFEKGLGDENGSIPMHPTWVLNKPTGNEKGSFLGIDLGRTIKGTNLRVCQVDFGEKGKFDITQSSFRVPKNIKSGTAEQLWEFVAESVRTFMELNKDTTGSENSMDIHLAFTFSFPVEQDSIDEAVLKGWLRGFAVSGVEGQDVVTQLQDALTKKGIPVKVIAVLNDCVGTLIASAYADATVMLGCIFGTGTSGAYFEYCGNISKLEHRNLPQHLRMAINCQWGEFKHAALPKTSFDEVLDHESSNPGSQTYEKTIAGLYLPELLRLIIFYLHNKFPNTFLFNQKLDKIGTPYSMDAGCLRIVEQDPYENLYDSGDYFDKNFNISITLPDLRLIRRLVEAIGKRAARLSSCVLAALCTKMGTNECSIGVDGSLFILYPHFAQRVSGGLADILDWESDRKKDPISLLPAEDGNGVGASLIAAMTMSRVRDGNFIGIKNRNAVF